MGNIRRFRIYDGRIQSEDGNVDIHQGQPHGLDTLTFPAWFNLDSGHKKYITCSFIKFLINNDAARYLVWPYSPDAMVEAHYDYDKQRVVIDRTKAVDHIAWYCGDRITLLKSWETAKVPGVSAKMRVWAMTCPGEDQVADPPADQPDGSDQSCEDACYDSWIAALQLCDENDDACSQAAWSDYVDCLYGCAAGGLTIEQARALATERTGVSY